MYRMGLMAMLVQGTEYDYHRWAAVRGGGWLEGWRRGCACMWRVVGGLAARVCTPADCLVALSSPGTCPPITTRCMKLALVHDVAEAIVGDITPTCGVSDADKHALEAAAVQRIKGMLGGTGSLAGGLGGWGWGGGQAENRWRPATSSHPPSLPLTLGACRSRGD